MDASYYCERARLAETFKEWFGVFIVASNSGFKRRESFDAERFEVFAESLVLARCDKIIAGAMGENAVTFRRFQRGFQR